MGRRILVVCLIALGCALCASPALAAFPWRPTDPAGQPPNDLNDNWKLAASPEQGNPFALDPMELNGVRGASVADQHPGYQVAWQYTTGRPDVTIAVLDSGIEWNDPAAMNDLRRKVRLNTGELPIPNHDRTQALDSGINCSTYRNAYDANGDGVVNIEDYACDTRVSLTDPRRVGPPGVLTPQDLIIAFSNGRDDDHNGFVDDIAGWDFLDNDNDPFDDVQYGHGTGEARDSNAEADNGGDVGTCPNCTVLPLRVGDSFIADVDNFAQAAFYATDNGVSVIQEALGTLNNSTLAQRAILYAYRHDVTIVASWADEAAEHHNQPAVLAHTIVVNSVTKYQDPYTSVPRSYLQLNGCTNFSSRVTVSVPSSSCSSEATGLSAGMVGLIYSAAENAHDAGKLAVHPDCTRLDSKPCVVTPNEARQLLATGTWGSSTQADDVDFAFSPEPSCTAALTPNCTDPNLNAPGNLAVAPLANSHRYPARKGPDEFYGYGRVNAARAVGAVAAGHVPPEAELFSPNWFDQIDPAQASLPVSGEVGAVRADGGRYTCRLLVAPGADPNNALTTDTPPGDFAPVAGGFCDGSTVHTTPFSGTLGTIDLAALKARFPSNAGDFTGRESGVNYAQTSHGRPDSQPYAFMVKVVVSATEGGTATTGQDRRQLFLHRDADMLSGWPRSLGGDGASPPIMADLNGDDRNELIVGSSDGLVHAYEPNGSELPGFPVRTDPIPAHAGERAYASGGIPIPGAPVLASVAVGDLHHDGYPDIVAADLDGRIYAWDRHGHRLWRKEANPAFSGKPLQPFVNVRQGVRDRTQHGFVSSPVIADLNGDGKPEVLIGGMDRHLYAFHGTNGSTVPGFPVLLVDRSKVASIQSGTDAVRFKPDSQIGDPLDQGAIVDTPAVGDINGDGKPEIVIGTNEEYAAGADGGMNAGNLNTASLGVLGQTGALAYGNTRLYAVSARGSVLPGWPVKVGQVFTDLLPVVGEGMTGSPVLGRLICPSGGVGTKIGAVPDAGPAYVFNPNGTSCLGKDPTNGHDIAMATDTPGVGSADTDLPAFAAVGQPVFGAFSGGTALLAPVAGVQRALDLALPEYQGGQDATAAWNPSNGQFEPGFPAPDNDLQFISGPAVGQLGASGGEDVLAGTASYDLQAWSQSGQPLSSAWPKLTGDWVVATPSIGSFGTLDDTSGAHKVVVAVTRLGQVQVYRTAAPACSPSSWPRFHHDQANSGDAQRDAIPPGAVLSARLRRGVLTFRAPGDDGLCGRAVRYVVTGARGQRIRAGVPRPAAPGTAQTIRGVGRGVTIQAVDDQGNLGFPVRLGKIRSRRTSHKHRHVRHRTHRRRRSGRFTG